MRLELNYLPLVETIIIHNSTNNEKNHHTIQLNFIVAIFIQNFMRSCTKLLIRLILLIIVGATVEIESVRDGYHPHGIEFKVMDVSVKHWKQFYDVSMMKPGEKKKTTSVLWQKF